MPDPFRKAKIIELMELFDDDEVTTLDQIKERPQKALDREMFQNAFKDKKADGGRIGFKDGLSVTEKKKIIKVQRGGRGRLPTVQIILPKKKLN